MKENGRMGESMDRYQDESKYLICWLYFLTDINTMRYLQGQPVACVFIYGMMEYSVGKWKEAQTLNQQTYLIPEHTIQFLQTSVSLARKLGFYQPPNLL